MHSTHGSWGVAAAFKLTRASFILQQLSPQIFELSKQQHGCRVVQAVLQAAAATQMDISQAVEAIIRGGLEELAVHPYGNYAVQVPPAARRMHRRRMHRRRMHRIVDARARLLAAQTHPPG